MNAIYYEFVLDSNRIEMMLQKGTEVINVTTKY